MEILPQKGVIYIIPKFAAALRNPQNPSEIRPQCGSKLLYPGVFIPAFNISTHFANRRCRGSSFLASVIHRTYSFRCV